MKAVIFGLLALAVLAQADFDWSKVRPKDVIPRRLRPSLWSHIRPRIIGGEEVEPHSLPHQAALLVTMDGDTYFCGGSVLDEKTILTAGHCVEDASNATVILGAHKFRENEATQLRIETTKFTLHEDYDGIDIINDIGLIHLPEAITMNENIQTVTLPSDDSDDYTDDSAMVSGWGLTSDTDTAVSEVLNKVNLQIISNSECNDWFFGGISSTNICANGPNDEIKSTCSGDSGGPLSVDGKQVGIVSFGIAFGCELGWPSAFTRVTKYLDWIEANKNN